MNQRNIKKQSSVTTTRVSHSTQGLSGNNGTKTELEFTGNGHVTVFEAGGLTFQYSHPKAQKGLDTSKRWFHIGGGNNLWRSQRKYGNVQSKPKRKMNFEKHAPGPRLAPRELPPQVFKTTKTYTPLSAAPLGDWDQIREQVMLLNDDVDKEKWIKDRIYDEWYTEEQNEAVYRHYQLNYPDFGLFDDDMPVTQSGSLDDAMDEALERDLELTDWIRSQIQRFDDESDMLYLLRLQSLGKLAAEIAQRCEERALYFRTTQGLVPGAYKKVDSLVETLNERLPGTLNAIDELVTSVKSKIDDVKVEKFEDAVEEITHDVHGVKKIVGDVEKAVSGVIAASIKPGVDKASNSIEKVAGSYDKLAKKIMSMLEDVTGQLCTQSFLADAASLMVDLVLDLKTYASSGLLIICTKVGNFLYRLIRLMFPHLLTNPATKVPNTQSGFSKVFDFFKRFIPVNLDFVFRVSKFANALFQLEKGLTSAKKLVAWCYDHLPDFLKTLLSHVMDTDRDFSKEVVAVNDEIILFLKKMDEIQDIAVVDIESLYSKVQALKEDLMLGGHMQLYNIVLRMEPSLSKVMYYAKYLARQMKPRHTPFCVVLSGASRCGKTILCNSIAEDMAAIEEHNGPVAYVRNVGSDYWDGFTENTYSVVYDDWLQDTEMSDVGEFFQLVTRSHFIVPMASLDNAAVGVKGTLCRSKLVLAATNVQDLTITDKKIIDVNALKSRIHMWVRIERIGEYDTSGNFEHILFHHDGVTYKYQDFMAHLLAEYDRHHAREKTITTMLSNSHQRIEGIIRKGRKAPIGYFPKDPNSQGGWEMFRKGTMYTACVTATAAVASHFVLDRLGQEILNRIKPEYYKTLTTLKSTASSIALVIGGIGLAFLWDRAKNCAISPWESLKVLLDWELGITDSYSAETLANTSVVAKEMRETRLAEETKVEWILRKMREHTDEIDGCEAWLDTRSERLSNILCYETESRTDKTKFSTRKQMITQSVADHPKITAMPKKNHLLKMNLESIMEKVREGNETFLQTEGMVDITGENIGDVIHDRICPVALVVKDTSKFFIGNTKPVNVVNALHIANQHFLFPRHFFLNADGNIVKSSSVDKYELHIQVKGVLYVLDFVPEKLKCITGKHGEWLEPCLYDFGGATIPQQRECLSFFVSNDDLTLLKPNIPTLMVGNTFGSGKPVQRKWNFNAVINKQRLQYKHMGKHDLFIVDGVTYDCSSAAGDCGSVLIALIPSMQRKCYGIHLFGGITASCSGGGIVTQEILKRALGDVKKVDVAQPVIFKQTPLAVATEADAFGLTLEVLGETHIAPHISRKNGFVETSLRDALGYIKEPAVLYGDPDPLLVGTYMYGSDVIEKDFFYKEDIVDYLFEKYEATNARILTTEEALNAHNGMDALNLHTSAGYPLCVLGLNKQDFICNNNGKLFFKNVEDLKFVDEECKSWENQVKDVYWISTLKDELVKPGKLARVFEVPPMIYTIATRKYFGSWISMMHENALKNFSCVGVNPESDEWAKVFYKLTDMSVYGIDADVSGWDKSLQPYVMDLALQSVNKWYKAWDPNWKQEDDIARNGLMNGMIHGKIVVSNMVYQKHKGMASGWVLTALFNTVCNMIQHLVWFMESVPDTLRDISYYDRCVSTLLYGDDSLDAIREDVLVFLNRETMSKVYKEWFTMDVTGSDKTGQLVKWNKIKDLQFLKRNFRLEGAMVKPLLDPLSIFSMLGYVRSSKFVEPDEQLKLNVETAARAMYFYGPDCYGKFIALLTELGVDVKLPKYSYYDRNFRGGAWEVYDFTF